MLLLDFVAAVRILLSQSLVGFKIGSTRRYYCRKDDLRKAGHNRVRLPGMLLRRDTLVVCNFVLKGSLEQPVRGRQIELAGYKGAGRLFSVHLARRDCDPLSG